MSSVNTSWSVKYIKTLKNCHIDCMKVYSSWWESCDKHKASSHAIYATRLSPQAVYFIQTGGGALSYTSSWAVEDLNNTPINSVSLTAECC